MKFALLTLSFIFGVNFVWEIFQMFLYADHTSGLGDFIFVHVRASLGDVVLFGIIYAFGALLFQSRIWFLRKTNSAYFFTMLCGFAVALVVEKYALATGRWQYTDLMPIIPFLKVGLSPILQMTILPLLTIILLQRKYQNKA